MALGAVAILFLLVTVSFYACGQAFANKLLANEDCSTVLMALGVTRVCVPGWVIRTTAACSTSVCVLFVHVWG